MSLNLVNASSQYLSMASPALALPYTILMWVRPTVNNTRVFWSTNNAGQDFYVGTTGTAWFIEANGSVSGGATTLNQWHFAVLRCISATNKRLAMMAFDGVASHIQNTNNVSQASITDVAIGRYAPANFFAWDGQLAEFCRIDADIQPDGAELSDTLLRQLAYRGPFSIPRIKKDIIEYRSFRSRTALNDTAEVYWRPGTPQPRWTATNAPLGGYPQPPHSAGYVTPWGGDRLLPVYELDEIVVPSVAERTQRGGFIANVGGLLSRF